MVNKKRALSPGMGSEQCVREATIDRQAVCVCVCVCVGVRVSGRAGGRVE
jgi:hypothetical protein